MRIGIDARFFGPESKGLGRYTQKLVEHLEMIDDEHTYVIFLLEENAHLYTPKNPRFTKVIANYRWYSVAEQIFFPLTLYRAKCDFVHFPHFNVPLLYRKPFLVTIHDLILLHFPTRKASTRSTFLYWVKFFAYRVVIAQALRRALHVIAVSHFTKDDVVAQYPFVADKISVTHEAGPEQHVIDDATCTRSLAGQGVQTPYMLYVGNAYPHKNVDRLVHAFARWSEETGDTKMRLVLIGRKDYFYDRLARMIADQGIARVQLLHTVDDVTLAALYKRAHAFVFPSLYEGFGLPPLEACAYGTPVLSSDAACLPEILGDAVLYCDMREEEEIVAGITKISSDKALRGTLTHKGAQQAHQYAWDRMVAQTHAVYQACVHMV